MSSWPQEAHGGQVPQRDRAENLGPSDPKIIVKGHPSAKEPAGLSMVAAALPVAAPGAVHSWLVPALARA